MCKGGGCVGARLCQCVSAMQTHFIGALHWPHHTSASRKGAAMYHLLVSPEQVERASLREILYGS